MTERDETMEASTPPKELLEAAARSVQNGASLASVAAWFNVPESQLQEWLTAPSQQVTRSAGGWRAPDVAAPISPEVAAGTVSAPHPAPGTQTTSAGGSPSTKRPATARTTHSIHTAPLPAVVPGTPAPKGFRDAVGTLRRRLLILLLGLMVGVTAGWFTAPGERRQRTTYRATHTLIYEARGAGNYNIEQVALLATSGEVPSRVAARLKLDRSQVRSGVSAEAQTDVSTISISARSATPDRAVALADVTAEELEAEIAGSYQAAADADRARLQTRLDSARDRFNAIPPKNAAEKAAAQSDVQAAERALQQYEPSKAAKPELRSLETASASAVPPAGVQVFESKAGRAGLLGLVGLLLGVAAAMGLDRLDSRIRSKSAAEAAFGAPVVAEVPRISKASENELLALTQPSSPFVEAYRGLRTYVALWAPEADVEDGHRVIVVTSPSPSEGKTTTVANLAAMLAEIGRSVVVVSADLRRPRIHQYFGVAAGPGLVEALAVKSGQPVFRGLDQATSVRGVRIVPSGSPVENPAPLFEHAEDLVDAVRTMADFVLIDAPPLLVANDAVELARHADGVLFVARAGQTSLEGAECCAETLRRLDIPVVGAVLVASEAASSASRYYASRYYAEPERNGRRRRRPSNPGGSLPVASTPPASAPEQVNGGSRLP
jgi:capsular exopolysaccharide synthesis family protein